METRNKDIIILGALACLSIIITAFMIPSAWAMYGGENQTLEFGFETDNCTRVPNITEGINFTFIGNQVIVEPALNFVGEFSITCYDWLTKEEETQSSGGGSSVLLSGWSAKCGYNKDCLSGTSNETNITLEVIDASPVDTTEDTAEPIIEEEEKERSKGWKFLIVILITLGAVLIGFIIHKIFEPKEEEEKEELPELIGFDDVEDYNNIQKGGQEV